VCSSDLIVGHKVFFNFLVVQMVLLIFSLMNYGMKQIILMEDSGK